MCNIGGHAVLWRMLTKAGMVGDVSSDSRSGGERTCMVARAKHQAKDKGGGGQGGEGVACKGIVAGH